MRGAARGFRLRLGGAITFAAVLTAAPAAAPPPATAIDVVVVDRDGRPVDGLGPDSFTVAVDGRPRRVLWVRHVSRGPGATVEAARRQGGRSDTLWFAAEPARNVLVVIDELSIQPGAERAAVQAAAMLVDRLGLDDRVAVLRVPVVRDAQMTLTTERPEVRAALRQVVGRAAPAGARPTSDAAAARQASDPDRVVADPDRVTVTERPPTEAPEAPKLGDEGPVAVGLLPGLQAVLASLRTSPGRKAVVVFSAGVPPADASAVDGVALAAISSRAVVHALGLPGSRDDLGHALDTAALERLARATGGSFSALGRSPEKALERVLSELGATYVLGLEPVASDLDGRRHAVRVETTRQAAAVRAPSALPAPADVEDVVPAPEPPPGTAGEDAGRGGIVRVGGTPDAGAAVSPELAAREMEVRRLLGRAADYVTGYQREYSLLVAEERYVQRSRAEQRVLRSDLLLVRPPGLESWVSFRDVFEIDGRPVRDREERLKRLFLDGSPEAQKQLAAIKEESSRLNIGMVERNINVPLYALRFLEADNLARCRFGLSGTKEVAGVSATRISFREVATPTLVRFDRTQDIAAVGWFLIDPASGAVVGTMLQLSFPRDGAVIEFTVRYERDTVLGLWVPAEMTESYTVRGSLTERVLVLDARAEYSNYRRFQVKAEAEVKEIKKNPE